MDKKLSDFYFWGVGYLLLVCALLISVEPGLIVEEVVAPKPIAASLLCFNLESKKLRSSDTDNGCIAPEESLGTGPIEHGDIRPTKLDRTLEVRFLAAQQVAKEVGHQLRITSGFRSQELQARFFLSAVKKYGSEKEASKWVLPKAISHHPWGVAIDINYPGDKTAVKWLEDHGSEFGLCRVYKNEWWHFEPTIAPGGMCPLMLESSLESLPTAQD